MLGFGSRPLASGDAADWAALLAVIQAAPGRTPSTSYQLKPCCGENPDTAHMMTGPRPAAAADVRLESGVGVSR